MQSSFCYICINNYAQAIFFLLSFYVLIVYKKKDRAFNYEMDLIFYKNHCMPGIDSGILLTIHVNPTNRKKQFRRDAAL